MEKPERMSAYPDSNNTNNIYGIMSIIAANIIRKTGTAPGIIVKKVSLEKINKQSVDK